MAKCPSCDGQALEHTLLAGSLPALGCSDCEGVLLSLVAYRRWSAHEHSEESETQPAVEMDDSKQVVNCPKCNGIMSKYRIFSDVENRIDYCEHCEEIWLDKGEWSLVEALARSNQLTAILTRPWQRRIVEEQTADMEENRLRDRLGNDYERFAATRDWLESHPSRDAIIAHLLRPWH